jgi:hypothetical protein
MADLLVGTNLGSISEIDEDGLPSPPGSPDLSSAATTTHIVRTLPDVSFAELASDAGDVVSQTTAPTPTHTPTPAPAPAPEPALAPVPGPTRNSRSITLTPSASTATEYIGTCVAYV